jgi:SAM-dependent methyltransferase
LTEKGVRKHLLPLMAKFDPESYRRFRPYYPAELYAPLASALEQRGFLAPFDIADVGCGTGHSAASLLRSGIQCRIAGVDPDPAMLEVAREICSEGRFEQGSGESTGLADRTFDAVTIGSAFHWMDAPRTREELQRILRRRGVALIYEYQFPKAIHNPALNEWIRREFNLRWRAPSQKPRGDFVTVTTALRGDPGWEVLEDYRVPMILELSPVELTGLLLSQSRILHYERGMDGPARAEFRRWLSEQVVARLGSGSERFDFNLQAGLFAVA